MNNNSIKLKAIINEDFTDYYEFYNKLVEELDEFKTAIINLRAINLLPQYYGNFEVVSHELDEKLKLIKK